VAVELKDHPDPRDRAEALEDPDHRDQPDHPDHQAVVDQQEQKETRDHPDQQDPRALVVVVECLVALTSYHQKVNL